MRAGGGESRGRLENSRSIRRKDRQRKDFQKTRLWVENLLLRQAEGSRSCVEGNGKGELPIPPVNHTAVKEHSDTFLKVCGELNH